MRKKRTPLAREATVILKNWMFEVRRLPALGVGVRVEAGKGLRLWVRPRGVRAHTPARRWLVTAQHFTHPYPTEVEKQQLMISTGLSKDQGALTKAPFLHAAPQCPLVLCVLPHTHSVP